MSSPPDPQTPSLKRKHPDDESTAAPSLDALLPSVPSDDSLLSDEESGSPADSTLLDDEDRRLKHKDAEKRRRVAINRSMSLLESLLPHGQGRKCSKAAVLTRTIEYIRSMRTLNRNLLDENRALQAELARAKMERTGAPAGSMGMFRAPPVHLQQSQPQLMAPPVYYDLQQQQQQQQQRAQMMYGQAMMAYAGMGVPCERLPLQWQGIPQIEDGKQYPAQYVGISGMSIPGSGLTQ